jgi:secreted PhoX family phosphatase
MYNVSKPLLAGFTLVTATTLFFACAKNVKSGAAEDDLATAAINRKADAPGLNNKLDLRHYSVTSPLIKKLAGFEDLQVYSMISSEDEFSGFRFGGSADGAGMVKDPNSEGYIMLVNNEDNYSVSKLYLDKQLKPLRGEYALNSDGGTWRLCSGTMVTPQEHGFGPLYLSAGESNVEAMTHAINPFAPASPNVAKGLSGLGRWSAENAVPLSKHAYPGKTVVLVGEDASDATGGQLVLYKSDAVGDLDNGSIYMLRRKDGVQQETAMQAGASYAVEFVKVENHKALTGSQIQGMVDPLQAIKFGRVEDIDYRKGTKNANREIYFNVTGQDPAGFNADRSRTVWGRVYQLVLDPKNPLEGRLTCVLDGDDKAGMAREFQNPDNIMVTENFVYIQEDSNTYGTERHDAYIYQYAIATGQLKKVFELDHRRTAPDAAKYNVGGLSAKGSWEYGALIDISDVVHVPNTFTLCIQPHSWTDSRFAGVDGGSKRVNEKQGSQVVIIQGLPK